MLAAIGLGSLALVILALFLLRPIFGYPSAINTTRWLLSSRAYKAKVLGQPDSPHGELKHIEWDGWGWGGQDTTVYLVFDPTDSLALAATFNKAGKYVGVPCEVARVARLENHWYTVQMYTNGDCWQRVASPSNSPTARFVLLPRGEKASVIRLCSRRGPKVDGSWKPAERDIATLESNLARISRLQSRGTLKGIRILHPENCYRQYIPVTIAGSKLIYVNAFCGIEDPGWRKQFVDICDGGESVWGVLYNPTTGEFSDLEVNGVA